MRLLLGEATFFGLRSIMLRQQEAFTQQVTEMVCAGGGRREGGGHCALR
jgi:hypothetical protein